MPEARTPRPRARDLEHPPLRWGPDDIPKLQLPDALARRDDRTNDTPSLPPRSKTAHAAHKTRESPDGDDKEYLPDWTDEITRNIERAQDGHIETTPKCPDSAPPSARHLQRASSPLPVIHAQSPLPLKLWASKFYGPLPYEPEHTSDTTSASQAPSSLSTTCVKSTAQISILLNLPPEIRALIYSHLPTPLIYPNPLIYCLSSTHSLKTHPLTSICRLIRAESLAIYYGQNTWILKLEEGGFYDAFIGWITDVGVGTQYLRRVRVCVRSPVLARKQYSYTISSAYSGEGEAMLEIDLSEKREGGRVSVVRSDGDGQGTEVARTTVACLALRLWEKKRDGYLGVADWMDFAEGAMNLLETGWWVRRKKGVLKSNA